MQLGSMESLAACRKLWERSHNRARMKGIESDFAIVAIAEALATKFDISFEEAIELPIIRAVVDLLGFNVVRHAAASGVGVEDLASLDRKRQQVSADVGLRSIGLDLVPRTATVVKLS